MKTLSGQETLEVVKKILKGDSYSSIAKEFEIGHSTVSYMAHNMGIRRSSYVPSIKKWTSEEVDKFLLANQSSIRRVSKVCHSRTPTTWKCSLCNYEWKQTFSSIQTRMKIGYSLQGCPDCGYNEFTVYHDFLNKMNHYAAYFVGVYMARGKMNGNSITISSKNKDKLEKIAELMACTYPIRSKCYKKDANKTYYLTFQSTKIAQKLPGKKTMANVSLPNGVGGKFFTDFLRGYTDFKGFFEYYTGPKYKVPLHRMTITGKTEFLTLIQNRYVRHLNTRKNLYGKETKQGTVNSTKKEYGLVGVYSAYYYMDWVYNSAVNPLRYMADSKYNAYLFLKEEVAQRQSRKKYIKGKQKRFNELMKEFHKTLTFEKIKEKYAVTRDQVKKISVGKSTSVPPETKEQILAEINQRRQLLKLVRELKTRVKHKAGIELRLA